ncbi:MAG TPA: gamma-glutamyl-gamma-aminobutyrate hydrolase family protein, partial [Trebonia sp.]
ESEERETRIKARALLETLREVEEARLAAERALTGPAEAEMAGSGSADYQESPPAPPASRPLRVLLVDHQDSFVHTLADYFRQQNAEVTTLRTGFPARLLDELAPDLVVLSPGPGQPSDFDCDGLLTELDARGLPAFGVCLGLQAMVEHAGGQLSLLPEPQHGKPGRIQVRGERPSALFTGLAEEFTAARYHSLYAREPDVKGGFTVTATTPDGVVMAIEDDAAGRWAVQFHPESILTAPGRSGHRIIANVLARCRARTGVSARPA